MFNTLKLRFYLFIFGCIGSRLMITALSAFAYGWVLTVMGLLALIPMYGWFYIIFFGKRDTGLEVFGGKIWWQNLRPVHMILWGFFGYLAIKGNRNAWIVLLIDTLFGAGAFFVNHWQTGDLKKMLA